MRLLTRTFYAFYTLLAHIVDGEFVIAYRDSQLTCLHPIFSVSLFF